MQEDTTHQACANKNKEKIENAIYEALPDGFKCDARQYKGVISIEIISNLEVSSHSSMGLPRNPVVFSFKLANYPSTKYSDTQLKDFTSVLKSELSAIKKARQGIIDAIALLELD